MNTKQLIELLQKYDPETDIAIYEGHAKEFTSDYGWETTDDTSEIQIFIKGFEGLSMPTFEEFYQFLKSYYLHSRFEARNTEGWGSDYSHCVALSHYETLERDGVGLISMYESRTATVVKYDQHLNILNADEPPGQIQKRAGRLTSILGSSAW